MENNLTKNTTLLAIGTFLTKAITFAMVPFFSRWISVSDYGDFDFYCAYITMLIPLLSLSFGEGIFRFGVDSDDETRAIHLFNGLFILLFGIGLVVISSLIANFAFSWSLAFPLGALLIAELSNKYLLSFLRSIKKLIIYSLSSVVVVVFVFASVTVLVRIFDMGLAGMIYGYAIGYFVSNVFVIVASKMPSYFRGGKISFPKMGEVVKYSLPLIPNSLSWWIINTSDRTIIKAVLGSVKNGIYSIAYKIPNLATSVFSVFNISWQETASEMINQEDRAVYFNRIFNRMIILLLTICGGIVACNFIFFGWVFHPDYNEGKYYTALLVSSVIFSSLSTFFGGIQVGLKDTKANGISTIIGAVVNVAIHLCLVWFIGLYAAAISTLLSTIVVALCRGLMLKKTVRFKLEKKVFLYIAYYVYICLMATLFENIYLNVINLVFAALIFIISNKDLILKVFRKG